MRGRSRGGARSMFSLPPRLLPVRRLDSLTAASHLYSFTVQSVETGEGCSGSLSHTRTQDAIDTPGNVTAEWGEGGINDGDGWVEIEGWWAQCNFVVCWKNQLSVLDSYARMTIYRLGVSQHTYIHNNRDIKSARLLILFWFYMYCNIITY